MRAPHTHPRVRSCACLCAGVYIWAIPQPRKTVRALAIGVERVRLGSQAFWGASAFNANIGPWNTASVTTLYGVCATFGQRRATAGVPDALGRSSMRRRPSCAAATPMRKQ